MAKTLLAKSPCDDISDDELNMSSAWSRDAEVSVPSSISIASKTPRALVPSKKRGPRARRNIVLSSPEASDDEATADVLRNHEDLADPVPQMATSEVPRSIRDMKPNLSKKNNRSQIRTTRDEPMLSLYIDGDSDTEPPDGQPSFLSGITPSISAISSGTAKTAVPGGSRSDTRQNRGDEDDANEEVEVITSLASPESPTALSPSFQTTSISVSSKTIKNMNTKKAKAAAERARMEHYAQELSDELNRDVFGYGLPRDTKLAWNNRLRATAGKAKWYPQRSAGQGPVTEIELAPKVLDCDERIRNTLSHEMCHLAVWHISGESKEQHGSNFRSWAKKVTSKRPDIEITTRHNYDINYRYEWKCANASCAKIYGRHSKSINPEKFVCGVCRSGRLIPQFATRSRAPKSTLEAHERISTAKQRDSPLAVLPPWPRSFESTPTRIRSCTTSLGVSDDENAESDVEILAMTIGGLKI